jgi:dTDP-4-dehydrorhamnose 3,5-epimerase
MRFSTERELLPGVRLVTLNRLADSRGSFVKTFQRSVFEANGEPFHFREEFYSTSHRDVIRGMHFQLPPHDHVKMVYCPSGAVLDVLLDLRSGNGQGRVASVILAEDDPSVLVIPKGVAHGFKSLRDNSLMIYKTSSEHAPTHDAGIRWDSFGFDWGCPAPVLSARDAALPALADFCSSS